MPRTEIVGPNSECVVNWTDAYGTSIKEGSLITYAVKGSSRVRVNRARVIRTDSRYIYVEVDGRYGRRNTRLHATRNIIVYAQSHDIVLSAYDSAVFADALISPKEPNDNLRAAVALYIEEALA